MPVIGLPLFFVIGIWIGVMIDDRRVAGSIPRAVTALKAVGRRHPHRGGLGAARHGHLAGGAASHVAVLDPAAQASVTVMTAV